MRDPRPVRPRRAGVRALVSILVALLLAGCGGTESNDAVRADAPTALPEAPRGWSELASPAALRRAPIAWGNAVQVWTGRELVVWGGHSAFAPNAVAHGAIYDAASDRWRPLPAGPLTGREEAGAAWTGQEVAIWGGMDGEWHPRDDGAALDPAAGRWRGLPPSPLGARRPAIAAWTAKELVLWGNASRVSAARDGAAYDPAADRWRRLRPAPLAVNSASAVWTGSEVVVYGALLDGANRSSTGHAVGLAYDPHRDRWRRLPPYPLSPQASTVAWTGAEVVAWDYELNAATYDPVRDAWHALPDLPLDPGECYPASAAVETGVFAWYCGRAAFLDGATRRWRAVPLPRRDFQGTPVAAGPLVLFLRSAKGGTANGLWAYRPR
ncbi:MAG: hypothetical protein ICV64_05000 [Thermoleophilia bacterium]|nr:hypothetical protein [Thermoleophilia bacterium]